jgi:GAF domain-containing protein
MAQVKNTREEKLSSQLQRLMAAIEASRRAVSPRPKDALLQSIVDAAGRIFGAAAASILLVNEKEGVLEFKVSFGASDHDLVGVKFPLDKGIAGYVVMTGQPIAISKVQNDPRFNQEFAKSTGYVPRSLLATPLQFEDQVIGVMEVLDKLAAPTFGLQDMELLGIFARQAAIAINLGQQVEQLNDALVNGIRGLLEPDLANRTSALARLLDEVKSQPAESNRNLFELAQLIYSISSQGDAERTACVKILSAINELVESKPGMDWSSADNLSG